MPQCQNKIMIVSVRVDIVGSEVPSACALNVAFFFMAFLTEALQPSDMIETRTLVKLSPK